MVKNKIITLSSLGCTALIFVLMNSVELGICSKLNYQCRTIADKLEHILYIFPLVLFFSLVTMFMKEAVFIAWWKFARFAIPIVLIISVVVSLELHHTPGGWFNLDNQVDLAVMSVTYLLFIIGSSIQMYRGFRRR